MKKLHLETWSLKNVSNKFKGKQYTSTYGIVGIIGLQNIDVFKAAGQVSLFMCVVVFGCLPMAH